MDIITRLLPIFIDEVSTKYHIYLQVMLGFLVIWFLFKKKDSEGMKFTEEEEEEIISNYEPLPLVDGNVDPIEERIVESKSGKYITINKNHCLNLASLSFLGLSENQEIEESAVASIRKYGVGSCGPRGFYGTVDVHLELEEKLAKFMGVEEAVVYSYGFSTLSSAIPAYAKRGDVIFVDEEVNFAIQKGLDASRSEIKFFRHNDMSHLEFLLEEQKAQDLKNKRKAAKTRRFLIVEGIFIKTGQICPLPELVDLRRKYKLRMFIDESISFGVLGDTGRGVTEHFNIPIEEVDMIMASMEFALGSVGGFCLGSTFIVEHQRLSGLGYCFSASLPPLLTAAAIKALDIIESNPGLIVKLREVCCNFHEALCNSNVLSGDFMVKGSVISPVKHLCPVEDNESNPSFLDLIVHECEKRGLAVIKTAYLAAEKKQVIPSIRLSINATLDIDDIKFSIKTLEDAVINAV